MGAYRTPIIDKLKKDSASFYTFGSAIEDIGLNINETSNKVALSHYVLLNIPYISDNNGGSGVFAIDNFFDSSTISKKENIIKNGGDYIFPKIMQNYALNFETILRNKGTYDYSTSQSVSEKTFWKFLQKSGALKLIKYTDDDNNNYYHEDFTSPDNAVIKGFGQIATSSQISNTYNMNNETYIMIPSSYGQMKYYMTEAFDTNYEKDKSYSLNSNSKLEGFSSSAEESQMDFPISDENNSYSTKSSFDGLQFEFDIEDIKKHLAYENNLNLIDLDRISYDNLAYDSSLCLGSKYSFNTILVYYSIYDTVGNSIATNLFGVMILDSTEDISEIATNQSLPAFNINFDSDTLSKELSTIANYSKSSETLYGKATGEFVLNAQDTVNLYITNEYIDEEQQIVGKNIEITLSLSKSEGIALQFIDGTDIDLTTQFGITDSDLPDTISITEIKGDDTNSIFYKITYTGEVYLEHSGLRFINKNDSNSCKVILADFSISKLSHYPASKSLGAKDSLYKIPSYLKTQTKEGSFGSEYSFRLNIQTASIYDKNSQIIDYSSGTQTIMDDFSGVLYNLSVAIDVLKANSVVQAKLYNDFQSVKSLSTNALSKVDTLEKDINNLLHGNVRIISADELNANAITTKSIIGETTFLDSYSNEIGNITNDVFYFDKIKTNEFSPSSIELSTVIVGNDGVNFEKDGEIVFKINSNGELMGAFQDGSFGTLECDTAEFNSLKTKELSITGTLTVNAFNINEASIQTINGSKSDYTFMNANSVTALSMDTSCINTQQIKKVTNVTYDGGLKFIPNDETDFDNYAYSTQLSERGNLYAPNIKCKHVSKNWYAGINNGDNIILYKISNIYQLLSDYIDAKALQAEGVPEDIVTELSELLYTDYEYVDKFINKYSYIVSYLICNSISSGNYDTNCIENGSELTDIENMAIFFDTITVETYDMPYITINGGISQLCQIQMQNPDSIDELYNIITIPLFVQGNLMHVYLYREFSGLGPDDLGDYSTKEYSIKGVGI